MKKLCLVLLICFASVQTAAAQTPPDGFTAIFNGQDLTGWVAMNAYSPHEFAALSTEEREAKKEAARKTTDKFWRVEEGELVNDGEGPFLTTEDEYRDFELLLDYKTVAGADSGVYLKATPQVQIWDTTKAGGKHKIGADKGSGGLWNNSKGAAGKDPLELADKPFGEWNHFRIRQIGARTDIWLNDKHIVKNAIMENYGDKSLPLIVRGPVQLQTHGGEIRWRNIYLREIPTEEANQILADSASDQFESIFSGTDFTGWQGPTENYEIEEGVVRCKAGKGGTVFTEREYGDFAVRFEFRLPPGGNNGLAIRYPGGQVDTAYHGMCELQVLDDTADKYQKLDARQFNGSAYGMAAAQRGYLRPVGQWNFEEVTVVGSKIKVELNGTVILDCDLSAVDSYLADKAHPGKDRKTGHFGLAGHNDPVEYRNLKIKDLSQPAQP